VLSMICPERMHSLGISGEGEMAKPASAGKMALIRSERCVRVRLHCQLDVT